MFKKEIEVGNFVKTHTLGVGGIGVVTNILSKQDTHNLLFGSEFSRMLDSYFWSWRYEKSYYIDFGCTIFQFREDEWNIWFNSDGKRDDFCTKNNIFWYPAQAVKLY